LIDAFEAFEGHVPLLPEQRSMLTHMAANDARPSR
jgi:hypothetical protein